MDGSPVHRFQRDPFLPTGCNRDSHWNHGWGICQKPRSNSPCLYQTTLKSVQLQRKPWTIPKVLFTLQGLQWQMCHQHSGCPQTLQVHDFGVNLSRSCLISYDVYTYLSIYIYGYLNKYIYIYIYIICIIMYTWDSKKEANSKLHAPNVELGPHTMKFVHTQDHSSEERGFLRPFLKTSSFVVTMMASCFDFNAWLLYVAITPSLCNATSKLGTSKASWKPKQQQTIKK